MSLKLLHMQICTSVFLIYVAFGQQAAQESSATRAHSGGSSRMQELVEELNSKVVGFHAATDIGKDLPGVEAVLLPIVNASPKNQYGRLDESASRYALHRYFMQRHAWDIRTFELPGATDEEAPCLFNFGRQVPYEAQAILEKHVVDQGASIVELSVFAALLEHLIHDEIPANLVKEYRAMGLPRHGALSKPEAESIIDFHMAVHITAEEISEYKPHQSQQLLKEIGMQYAVWNEAKQLFRSAQMSLLPNATEFSFWDVLTVVSHLEDKMSEVTQKQCTLLKNKLLNVETPGSGRVPLVDFYHTALHKPEPQFMERLEYLRDLGAVDESDPFGPRLVISNYVDGPSNCVARTPYYSACCVDECVELFSELERHIGAPTGTPDEIFTVVRQLRNPDLPTALTDRLIALAQQNDGQVLLHGTQFTEWMHYAFPRECTAPQMFGPAHFMTQEQWQEQAGSDAQADVQDVETYIADLEKAQKGPTSSPEQKLVAPSVVVPAAWVEDEAVSKEENAPCLDESSCQQKGVANIQKRQGNVHGTSEEAVEVITESNADVSKVAEEPSIEIAPRTASLRRLNFKWVALIGVATSLVALQHHRLTTKGKREDKAFRHEPSLTSSIV